MIYNVVKCNFNEVPADYRKAREKISEFLNYEDDCKVIKSFTDQATAFDYYSEVAKNNNYGSLYRLQLWASKKELYDVLFYGVVEIAETEEEAYDIETDGIICGGMIDEPGMCVLIDDTLEKAIEKHFSNQKLIEEQSDETPTGLNDLESYYEEEIEEI